MATRVTCPECGTAQQVPLGQPQLECPECDASSAIAWVETVSRQSHCHYPGGAAECVYGVVLRNA